MTAVIATARAGDRRSIALDKIAALPFITFSRTTAPWYRAQLDRIFLAGGVQPATVEEVHDKGTLLGLLRADVGVSILPLHGADGAVGVVTLSLDVDERYTLAAVWRSDDASLLRHTSSMPSRENFSPR